MQGRCRAAALQGLPYGYLCEELMVSRGSGDSSDAPISVVSDSLVRPPSRAHSLKLQLLLVPPALHTWPS